MAYDFDEPPGGINTYLHYPRDPEFVFNQSKQYGQASDPKPCGLWVSVGTKWIDWCRDNDFMHWQESPFEFKFSEDSNFLMIYDASQMLHFTKKYVATVDENLSYINNYFIDWEKVANDYQGIFIMPYIWSCRLDNRTRWYYGWDVASGVVWDLSTIVEVKRWVDESKGIQLKAEWI